jgi:hypothetical protein
VIGTITDQPGLVELPRVALAGRKYEGFRPL